MPPQGLKTLLASFTAPKEKASFLKQLDVKQRLIALMGCNPVVRIGILFAQAVIPAHLADALAAMSEDQFKSTIAAANSEQALQLRLAFVAGCKRGDSGMPIHPLAVGSHAYFGPL